MRAGMKYALGPLLLCFATEFEKERLYGFVCAPMIFHPKYHRRKALDDF